MAKTFSDLPQAVQNVYLSTDVENMVMDIGQENGLHIDEIGIVMEEIRQVLIGELPREKFPSQIKHMLDISQDVAEKVTLDINKYVFDPLREELMKVSSPTPPGTDQTNVHPDEIMNAISNPSSIPSPTRTVDTPPVTVSPTTLPPVSTLPAVETVPATATGPIAQLPEIAPQTTPAPIQSAPHELKLSEPVHIDPAKTDSSVKTSSLIPPEVKERINKDPYKEAI